MSCLMAVCAPAHNVSSKQVMFHRMAPHCRVKRLALGSTASRKQGWDLNQALSDSKSVFSLCPSHPGTNRFERIRPLASGHGGVRTGRTLESRSPFSAMPPCEQVSEFPLCSPTSVNLRVGGTHGKTRGHSGRCPFFEDRAFLS